MTTETRSRRTGIALAVAGALAAAIVPFATVWVAAAGGGSEADRANRTPTVPDWFLPIADYYDRNPAVTPTFDFASLYDPNTAVSRPPGRSTVGPPVPRFAAPEYGNGSNAITGSWSVTVDRGPAGVLSSLQSFTRGGSVIETANTVGNRGPSHGAWTSLSNRLYATTIVFFRFDATGTFVGSQKIKRTLRLSRDGDSFTAVSISELLDPAGNVIPTPFPLRATEVATRIEVERIPDVP